MMAFSWSISRLSPSISRCWSSILFSRITQRGQGVGSVAATPSFDHTGILASIPPGPQPCGKALTNYRSAHHGFPADFGLLRAEVSRERTVACQKSVLRRLLGVERTVVEDLEWDEERGALVAWVRPNAKERESCLTAGGAALDTTRAPALAAGEASTSALSRSSPLSRIDPGSLSRSSPL